MKQSRTLTIILFLAGLMLTFFGAFATFFPEAYTARHSIEILGNVNLYNEFRGTGGILMAVGLITLSGALRSALSFTAIIVASTTFLMFGTTRLFSIIVDGMPVSGIVRATIVEIIVGLICVWAYFKFREQ